MNFDGEKAAVQAKGVLGPILAATSTLFLAFGGVDLSADFTSVTEQLGDWLVLTAALCGSVVGLYGRIVANTQITSLFK